MCWGRLISFAGLMYAGDTSDPERSKFYGDIQEKLTAITTQLLFFELEINRLEDATLDAALAVPELGYYKPWLVDLRKERPHQLEDRIEQLFHEKNVTGRAAWNRLFDETMSALRFDVDGEELSVEPVLSRMLEPDPERRRTAANAIAKTLGENVRLFTLITNTLAKDKEISDRVAQFRGYRRFAAPGEPGRAAGGRCPGTVGAGGLSQAVASLLCAQGEVAGPRQAQSLGPQRATS